MNTERYLTKSRFKLASECPRKLFYSNKAAYANQKLNDPFLEALADGGFQVGELAKHYFPGGIEIGRGDYSETASRTRELILAGDVIIYEAAFLFENYFIYTDILERRGDTLSIHEVKAKSIDPTVDRFMRKDGKGILAAWEPYILDVAFQKMVVQKAFPEFQVSANLMMVDKTSRCLTDGLNQKFRVRRTSDGEIEMIVDPPNADDLASRLLVNINLDDVCEMIFSGAAYKSPLDQTFEETAGAFAASYSEDIKLLPKPTKMCRDCEFRASDEDRQKGLLDGFRECWRETFGWGDADFTEPSVLDIWSFLGKDKLIKEGRVKIDSVTQTDIGIDESDGIGLSKKQRQWLQVAKAQNRDDQLYIDRAGLSSELASWTFPLHFIDFETSMPAIPFNKGRRPYEGIAFQFSHHIVYADGRIEHKGQFLQAKPGVFPSYEFLRSLKTELADSPGTIFQYSAFENTYLNHIFDQLIEEENVPDRQVLMDFIRSIAKPKKNSDETWEDTGRMVDMLELVKKFYYDPLTGGSNSIKAVLPAVLNRSLFLQEKYSKPIYGTEDQIPSLNFDNWTWIKRNESGEIIDPYKLLPKMFEDVSDEDLDAFMTDSDELRDGGAALTAYAKLQFQEMSVIERSQIETALLKYCELDTLAMVMIYEGWREMLR